MDKHNNEDIRKAVRESYGKVALSPEGSCGCSSADSTGCCSPTPALNPKDASKALGYSTEDISAVPEGANMGLGCGNPRAIASLKPGETVLDLGSGGGFDAFLAARAVGKEGRVIGVDMTAEMVSKARANAISGSYDNVEFRLGEIEHLPVADNSVDVIISNCVINLSPEKDKVFKDAFRVLKPGGRIAVSDVVATAEMPEHIKQDVALHTGCIAGASTLEDLERILHQMGFSEIVLTPKEESRAFIAQWLPGKGLENYVVSADIEAIKPL